MSKTLSVYYGVITRWDHALLQRVQQTLGRECVRFDGLQANFEFDSQKEALAALFVVRGMDLYAQVGNIGEGPPQHALDAARAIMQENYLKEFEP